MTDTLQTSKCHIVQQANHKYPPDDTTDKHLIKLSFSTLRNTKIQTFQYKILHRVILCNKWLYNIQIKESAICNYCNEVDDIPHFFLKCSKVKEFWNMMKNWLEQLSELNLKNIPIFNEYIIGISRSHSRN